MANTVPFTWETQTVPDSASDGGFTRSQSALYARIKLSGQVIGLAQQISWEGQSGNAPINGIGEPFSENKPGQQFFTWSMGSFSVRKRRFIQLVNLIYPGLKGVIDFRTIPFELEIDFTMKAPSGATSFENNNEKLEGCWLQTWRGEFSGPNELRMESLTGWAQGYTMTDGGTGGSTIIATIGSIPDNSAMAHFVNDQGEANGVERQGSSGSGPGHET